MNYLTLGQVILLAELVTGIDENTLRRISRIELISSALNAPQSEYSEVELYPDFNRKAAILCIRISQITIVAQISNCATYAISVRKLALDAKFFLIKFWIERLPKLLRFCSLVPHQVSSHHAMLARIHLVNQQ